MAAAGGTWVNDGGQESLPQARIDGLVQTESGSEVLVYDVETHHIHQLNAVTAAVWRLCDGRRSVAAIAQEASETIGVDVEPAMVRVALGKLADADLLASQLDPSLSAVPQTRRSLLRKVAKGGAVVIPTIVSITAPLADAAASSGCTMAAIGRPVDFCTSNRIGYCCFKPSGGTGICDLWRYCSDTVDGSPPG